LVGKTELWQKDQAIAEVDSDKATLELPAGKLVYHIKKAGEIW
jgi:pyruvate/2-oxoglutarate dehydrogenase complex dihydrolipoamide acyltransferase (E2) component